MRAILVLLVIALWMVSQIHLHSFTSFAETKKVDPFLCLSKIELAALDN